jgi:hypothetical protein
VNDCAQTFGLGTDYLNSEFISLMLQLTKTEWWILISLLLLSFVPGVGGALRLLELMQDSQLEFLPANPRVQSAPTPVIFHLIGVIPYCFIGAFQFLPSIRKRYPNFHRGMGGALIVAGLFSSVSGLWMTHFYSFPESLQGALLYWVRWVVGVAMTGFILHGIRCIWRRRFPEHGAWMIRAYALGQGAGTQVIVGILWAIPFGEATGFTRDILMTLAWVINVIIAEWIIYRSKRPRTAAILIPSAKPVPN